MQTRPSSSTRVLSGAEVITAAAVLGAAATAIGVYLAAFLRDDQRPVAQVETALVAEELLTIEGAPAEIQPSAQPLSSRGPASVAMPSARRVHLTEGEVMRRDPWGHPYRYRAQRDAENRLLALVVWSVGPNGVPETPVVRKASENRVFSSAEFSGDDVGFVRIAQASTED